ncbi:MAG: GntR family transcriptional regulator [Pseudonocardia sp.]|nr:GntR family transcriptional regulator [Pseudonocardia sp.]
MEHDTGRGPADPQVTKREQVKSALRDQLSGMTPGARLRTLDELGRLFGVGPKTVHEALRELAQAEGTVESRGPGGWVRAGGPPRPTRASAKLRRATARDRLLATLRDQVAQLKPGEPLPKTDALAKEHHVSHDTVRDVLRALEHEGKVEPRGQGAKGAGWIRAGGPPVQTELQRVTAAIRKEIAVLPPGARLDSREVLASRHGVGRTTVGDALRGLVKAGLVENRGKGTRCGWVIPEAAQDPSVRRADEPDEPDSDRPGKEPPAQTDPPEHGAGQRPSGPTSSGGPAGAAARTDDGAEQGPVARRNDGAEQGPVARHDRSGPATGRTSPSASRPDLDSAPEPTRRASLTPAEGASTATQRSRTPIGQPLTSVMKAQHSPPEGALPRPGPVDGGPSTGPTRAEPEPAESHKPAEVPPAEPPQPIHSGAPRIEGGPASAWPV